MSNKLKETRKENGLTQIEAAKLLGISRRTYQSYEESNISNQTYNSFIKKLENCLANPSKLILSIKTIKNKCQPIFAKYPKVKCAYLYGSYSRGEATEDSDIDFLVVDEVMGIDYFDLAYQLEEVLHKQIDLQTHRQIGDATDWLADILIEGIKIYSKN